MLIFTCSKCGQRIAGITLKDLRSLVNKKKNPCGCAMKESDVKQNDEFLKSHGE